MDRAIVLQRFLDTMNRLSICSNTSSEYINNRSGIYDDIKSITNRLDERVNEFIKDRNLPENIDTDFLYEGNKYNETRYIVSVYKTYDKYNFDYEVGIMRMCIHADDDERDQTQLLMVKNELSYINSLSLGEIDYFTNGVQLLINTFNKELGKIESKYE